MKSKYFRTPSKTLTNMKPNMKIFDIYSPKGDIK